MVSDAFGRLESFWQAVGGSFLGGWLVVENASKLFFSRDPERPFDTERPRNWGSFGAELNGLKPWRRGGFRCFLGGWLVVENAGELSFFYFFYRDPERPFDTERPRNWGSFGAELNGLKPWRRGGFRCFLGGWLVVEDASKLSFFYRNPERPFDTERPRNWGSFGAELNGLKPWRRGGFRCFLGGWLVVENASKQSREQAMKRSARARTSTPERNDDSRRATFKRTTETPVRKTLAMPTSGGKAGPENPGSAAGAAALKSGRRPGRPWHARRAFGGNRRL